MKTNLKILFVLSLLFTTTGVIADDSDTEQNSSTDEANTWYYDYLPEAIRVALNLNDCNPYPECENEHLSASSEQSVSNEEESPE